jgi:hypothetical protein
MAIKIKHLIRWAGGTVFVLCVAAALFVARHPTILLPYAEFNQKGSGWRAIYDSGGDCRRAADEIETYFRFHPELSASDRAILHFHAAQMFAGAGMI